jgi:hypothetical protein
MSWGLGRSEGVGDDDGGAAGAGGAVTEGRRRGRNVLISLTEIREDMPLRPFKLIHSTVFCSPHLCEYSVDFSLDAVHHYDENGLADHAKSHLRYKLYISRRLNS